MVREKRLPDSISNKRFDNKADALMRLNGELMAIDSGCLVDIPLAGSSSLALFNALSESLRLDAERVLENKRG